MKTSYSRSVKKTIKSELGINTSKNDTNIASSISASYESQYETSYRFKMDQYPTDCFYEAAAFGYVVKYLVQKKSFFSSYSYYKNCYTFNRKKGTDLRLINILEANYGKIHKKKYSHDDLCISN